MPRRKEQLPRLKAIPELETSSDLTRELQEALEDAEIAMVTLQDKICDSIQGPLQLFLSQFNTSSKVEKKCACQIVNQILNHFDISAVCPKTSRPAYLRFIDGEGSERFRYVSRDQKSSILSSQKAIPEVHLVPSKFNANSHETWSSLLRNRAEVESSSRSK